MVSNMLGPPYSRCMPQRLVAVAQRASTVELLLDLVFVFTITRVTDIIAEDHSWAGIGRAALTLIVVWWMYDAFVWLGNQTDASRVATRLGFVAAMVAFLLIAVAIPRVFDGSGLLFGYAYLAVVIIHTVMFVWFGRSDGGRPILRVVPTNVGGAVLLIVAGYVGDPADWILFCAALVLFVIGSFSGGPTGFDLGSSHFVERHGLLMIIAFGETIVAIGVNAGHREIDASVILGTILSVAIVAGFWWLYFSGDDERADERFKATDLRRRALLALTAFGFDHYAMIFGVVLFSAGVSIATGPVVALASPVAVWLLAAGVALYLLGDARFRQELDLGPSLLRYLGAVVCVGAGALGLVAAVGWELVALLAILVVILVAESRLVRSARE
jgi:low temperature requirement protein LtrA